MKRRDFLKAGLVSAGAVATGIGAADIFAPSIAYAANPKAKIKIGYLPITDHLLILAAANQKFKHVEIVPVKFSAWPDITDALKSGAIDAAFLLTPIGISLRQKGIPIKVVYLGHRNGSVITVKTGDEIKSVQDLKNRAIAIPSRFSTHNILLRKVLTDKGINPDKEVRMIDMAPPEMPVALATGRIDGYIVAEPFGAQAEFQKVGKILIMSKDIWPNHICCVLNVHETALQKYPEAIKEIVTAMHKTAQFIEKNPESAAKQSEQFLGQKPEIVQYVLTKPAGRLTFNRLVPEMHDFIATQDLMIKFGIANTKINLNEYVDSRYHTI